MPHLQQLDQSLSDDAASILNMQVALTSICQEGLRWTLAPETGSTDVQQDRLPFLTGLAIVAARLAAAVAAQVAALASSLADPLGPDEQAAAWEPYYALLQFLSGQSKVKPTARCDLPSVRAA